MALVFWWSSNTTIREFARSPDKESHIRRFGRIRPTPGFRDELQDVTHLISPYLLCSSNHRTPYIVCQAKIMGSEKGRIRACPVFRAYRQHQPFIIGIGRGRTAEVEALDHDLKKRTVE